jgi:hypothetical protein
MVRHVAALDGSINAEQQKPIDATEAYFASRVPKSPRKWA